MRTTPMLRLAFGLAALVAALAVPEVGGAGTCASTCGAEKRTCQLATVTAFRTCRADVRASRATGLSRRDAIRNCRGAMRQAHQMCVGIAARLPGRVRHAARELLSSRLR